MSEMKTENNQKPVSLFPIVRAWWPLLLGHCLEWYDFAVYGYLAESMRINFFRGSSMGVWFGFSVTFAARPFGGIILGRMADVVGRRNASLVSMGGMLVATMGQGLLPSYMCCGDTGGQIGLYLLLSLRLMQGLFVGGELPSVVAYVTETAPRQSLALATSISIALALCGFLFADSLVALIGETIGQDMMIQWGWRILFFIPLLPGAVAWRYRLDIQETEEFLNAKSRLEVRGVDAAGVSGTQGKTIPFSLRVKTMASVGAEFVRSHGGAALIGLGGVASAATTFYVGAVWSITYLRDQGMEPGTATWLGVLFNVICIAFVALFAYIADIVGVAAVELFGTMYIAALGLPCFILLHTNPTDPMLGFLCVSLGYGSAAGIQLSVVYLFCAELFPTPVRALGFAVSFNVAFAYFGGLSGLVAQESLHLSPLGPGIYLSAVGLFSAATISLGLCARAKGRVQLTHLRDAPYFGRTVPETVPKDAVLPSEETTSGNVARNLADV